MRILCDAIAFCYGPATALKQAMTVWQREGVELTVLATGTTREYLEHCGHADRIIVTDTESPACVGELRGKNWDLLLSVCNPLGFSLLRPFARRSVYWDFLLWMRTDRGDEFDADYYVAEMFPGTEAAIPRWKDEIRRLVTSPILVDWIPEVADASNATTLLVNLGGQRSALTVPWETSIYAPFMVGCLQKASEGLPRSWRYLVTSDEATSARLRVEFSMPGWEFLSLSHEEFLAELKASAVVLTHPGLYSPFESFGHGKPTFFLPSSNYTQILQLREFRRIGLAPCSVDWIDLLGEEVDIPMGLPEEEGVRRVLKVMAETSRRSDLKSRLERTLRAWLEIDMLQANQIASSQRLAARPFFGDYRGFLEDLIRNVGVDLAREDQQ